MSNTVCRRSVCVWCTEAEQLCLRFYMLLPCWVKQSPGPNATVKVVDPETTRVLPHMHVRVCLCAFIRTQVILGNKWRSSDEKSNSVKIINLHLSNYNPLLTCSFRNGIFPTDINVQAVLLDFSSHAASFVKGHITSEAKHHSHWFLRRWRGKEPLQKADTSSGSWLLDYVWEVNHWNKGRLWGMMEGVVGREVGDDGGVGGEGSGGWWSGWWGSGGMKKRETGIQNGGSVTAAGFNDSYDCTKPKYVTKTWWWKQNQLGNKYNVKYSPIWRKRFASHEVVITWDMNSSEDCCVMLCSLTILQRVTLLFQSSF